MGPNGDGCSQHVPTVDRPEIAAIEAAGYGRKHEELGCRQVAASTPARQQASSRVLSVGYGAEPAVDRHERAVPTYSIAGDGSNRLQQQRMPRQIAACVGQRLQRLRESDDRQLAL